MKRLNPDKLRVTYLPGVLVDRLTIPRRYTLTHSDRTGVLYLSIGNDYDAKQIAKLYTKLMRDEVLAELVGQGENLALKVYCHVSGGLVIGTAGWRYSIFCAELSLALEALRYGDRNLFDTNQKLDQTPAVIYFKSSDRRYNLIEQRGVIADYR